MSCSLCLCFCRTLYLDHMLISVILTVTHAFFLSFCFDCSLLSLYDTSGACWTSGLLVVLVFRLLYEEVRGQEGWCWRWCWLPCGEADLCCLSSGLVEDRTTAAEEAAGDGMSRVAPPTDPATAGPVTSTATAAPASAPATAAATEGQPVPPPRKHSVRSRADGLRDALQDLSPVKGQTGHMTSPRSKVRWSDGSQDLSSVIGRVVLDSFFRTDSTLTLMTIQVTQLRLNSKPKFTNLTQL